MSIISGINSLSWTSGSSQITRSNQTSGDPEIGKLLGNKTSSTQKNDPKELNEQEVMQKASSYMGNAITKYDVSNNVKEGKKIEKALENSKIPNMPMVGTTIKTELASISENITQLAGSIPDKCADCKTEDEIKAAIKDVLAEMQQEKHKANVYTQRGQKAIDLNNKLTQAYSDPKKAALLDKIDINKITSKLTEPVEDVDLSSIDENNTDDKTKEKAADKAFEEALKEDEISNVVTSLIEYIDKGEKDKFLDDYVKDDNSNNNSQPNEIARNNITNPFNIANNNKENPFGQKKMGLFTT